MIATGKTIQDAITTLLRAGAAPRFWIAATHALLVGRVREVLRHPAIQHVAVTDSVQHDTADWPGLTLVSIAPLLAAVIRRLDAGESLADIYGARGP